MLGGYATAARWSRHYAEMADKIGADLRAAIADRAPEVKAFSAARAALAVIDGIIHDWHAGLRRPIESAWEF